jgi:hypothetical protein
MCKKLQKRFCYCFDRLKSMTCSNNEFDLFGSKLTNNSVAQNLGKMQCKIKRQIQTLKIPDKRFPRWNSATPIFAETVRDTTVRFNSQPTNRIWYGGYQVPNCSGDKTDPPPKLVFALRQWWICHRKSVSCIVVILILPRYLKWPTPADRFLSTLCDHWVKQFGICIICS